MMNHAFLLILLQYALFRGTNGLCTGIGGECENNCYCCDDLFCGSSCTECLSVRDRFEPDSVCASQGYILGPGFESSGWSAAQDFCQDQYNTDLATITSSLAFENAQQVCAMGTFVGKSQGCWVGLYQDTAAPPDEPDNDWMWISNTVGTGYVITEDGTAVDDENIWLRINGNLVPDNSNGGLEDCAHIIYGEFQSGERFLFNDIRCNRVDNYALCNCPGCWSSDQCCGNLACEFINGVGLPGFCCILLNDQSEHCTCSQDCCGSLKCTVESGSDSNSVGLCVECLKEGDGTCTKDSDCCNANTELLCNTDTGICTQCAESCISNDECCNSLVCRDDGTMDKCLECIDFQQEDMCQENDECCGELICRQDLNNCCVPEGVYNCYFDEDCCDDEHFCVNADVAQNRFGKCSSCQEAAGSCDDHNDCCEGKCRSKDNRCGPCLELGSIGCTTGFDECCEELSCVQRQCCSEIGGECVDDVHCCGGDNVICNDSQRCIECIEIGETQCLNDLECCNNGNCVNGKCVQDNNSDDTGSSEEI